ncbi:MAG: methionyl-tRNA formyltransferase [Lachnospiraceae bacterium]|nr:methionyl-tRNA formyltransferase [Lachnospiraceae bacterium]
MNIVFMGTPDFSVEALKSLIAAGHNITAVVTQPDKKKGRGEKVMFTPVKEEALKHDLKVYQPVKVREPEFIDELKKLDIDVIVVIAFGQILPKEILEMGQYGCINVHASLLPKYRGAAPIQWAVIDGEEESGVTTMQMNEGLDTGDILEVVKVPIDKKETGGSLFDKLSIAGANLIVKTLDDLQAGTVTPVKQDDTKSNYAKMLKKELGNIDFNQEAVKIERLIRGLNPWPSAYTKLADKTLKIWDADVVDKDYEGENGEIVEVTKDYFVVKTGSKSLKINELQLEGKKRMKSDIFLRGNKLEKGVVLK